MRRKLTDIVVNKTKPDPKRIKEVWDLQLPGFGLRILPSGVRTYCVMYRIAGKQRRQSLGDTRKVKLGEARDKALAVLGQVERGRDPKAVASAADGFAAAVKAYLKDISSNVKPKTMAGYRRLLETGPVAAWGDRAVDDITRSDVRLMLDGVKGRAPVGVNRTLAVTGQFFNWCLDKEIIAASPVAKIKKPARERARTRVLSEEEIGWLWEAAGEIGAPFGDFVKFLIATAQRRDEAGRAEWREIDLKSRTWTIPGERAKNGEPHEVALSDLAASLLGEAGKGFIFTTNGGEAPISGYSKAQGRLRRGMLRARRRKFGLPEKDADLRKHLGLADAAPLPVEIAHWTLHDLRRSAATYLAKRGAEERVIKAVLNHKPGKSSGVTSIYNRHRYADEARAALLDWGQHLAALVAAKSEAVVA